MVVGILILDAQRAGHDERLREKGGKVKDKDLTLLLPNIIARILTMRFRKGMKYRLFKIVLLG